MAYPDINKLRYVTDYCTVLESHTSMRLVCCGTRQEHLDGTIADHRFDDQDDYDERHDA